MSAAIFETFVPGCELQLVARDARAGDAADEGRLDPEVLERLDERVADPVGRSRIGLAGRLRPAQQAAVGQHVLAVLLRRRPSKSVGGSSVERAPSGRASGGGSAPTTSGNAFTASTGGLGLARRSFGGGGAAVGARRLRRLAAALRTA